jgi:hypothetical protein
LREHEITNSLKLLVGSHAAVAADINKTTIYSTAFPNCLIFNKQKSRHWLTYAQSAMVKTNEHFQIQRWGSETRLAAAA